MKTLKDVDYVFWDDRAYRSILNALSLGEKRHADLTVCPNPKTRSRKIKHLLEEGFIRVSRRKGASNFYLLTERGKQLLFQLLCDDKRKQSSV